MRTDMVSDFTRTEFKRLLQVMSNTDPTESGYEVVLKNLTDFITIAGTVNEVLATMEEVDDGTEEDSKRGLNTDESTPSEVKEDVAPAVEEKEEPTSIPVENPPTAATETDEQPETETESEEVKFTALEVRQALGDLRNSKGTNIPQLLNELVGVTSFGSIPKAKYADIMAYIESVK